MYLLEFAVISIFIIIGCRKCSKNWQKKTVFDKNTKISRNLTENQKFILCYKIPTRSDRRGLIRPKTRHFSYNKTGGIRWNFGTI